jgi:GntR family transcriptional regulator, rspAB operon transcriptional repressor
VTLNRPPRLHEHAYELIRRALVGRKWADGKPLLEDELARDLSMSRTPVREALIRLSIAGLVEPTANGYVVPRLSLRDIREYYELRILLEPQAAALAAQAPSAGFTRLLESDVFTHDHVEAQRFSDFHVTIAEAAGNAALASLITMVNDRISNWRLRSNMTQTTAELLHQGHEQIRAALLERDSDGAMRAMDAHLRFARDWVLEERRGHDSDVPDLAKPVTPAARLGRLPR